MKLGTRGSRLALWQAHAVARSIEATGGPTCEIVVIRTSGDEGTLGTAHASAGTREAARGISPAAFPSVKRLFV